MRIPTLQGIIRRRFLVNFRVDPEVMARQLPPPFAPKLHAGHAIAGICLIRLEELRPAGLPAALGVTSENAAHRVAVQWEAEGRIQEGVYIPRRDTTSRLNWLAGGRLFPGEHHLGRLHVEERGSRVTLELASADGAVSLALRGGTGTELPPGSCFTSLAEASAFFERGSLGYSATRGGHRLHGVTLETAGWHVAPFDVEEVRSSWFADRARFPVGSVAFDHALVMRGVEHRWHGAPDLRPEGPPPRV